MFFLILKCYRLTCPLYRIAVLQLLSSSSEISQEWTQQVIGSWFIHPLPFGFSLTIGLWCCRITWTFSRQPNNFICSPLFLKQMPVCKRANTPMGAALSGSRNPEPFGCFAVPVFNMLESRWQQPKAKNWFPFSENGCHWQLVSCYCRALAAACRYYVDTATNKARSESRS